MTLAWTNAPWGESSTASSCGSFLPTLIRAGKTASSIPSLSPAQFSKHRCTSQWVSGFIVLLKKRIPAVRLGRRSAPQRERGQRKDFGFAIFSRLERSFPVHSTLQVGRARDLSRLFPHPGGNCCLDVPDGFAETTGNRRLDRTFANRHGPSYRN